MTQPRIQQSIQIVWFPPFEHLRVELVSTTRGGACFARDHGVPNTEYISLVEGHQSYIYFIELFLQETVSL